MADEPMTDLGLAVLLLNSVDLLEDPSDRMASSSGSASARANRGTIVAVIARGRSTH